MSISLAKSRKALGIMSKNMSDDDMQALLVQFYKLAEVVANTVINRGSKNQSKGIEVPNQEVHNGAK